MSTIADPADLAELAADYAAAKDAENQWATRRRVLAGIIQSITDHDSESQKTYAADGWKITVKAPLILTMDWNQWEQTKTSIPESLWPVEMKAVLDEKGVKWLHNNEPELYRILAECLTVKPGAVQVTVQPTEP